MNRALWCCGVLTLLIVFAMLSCERDIDEEADELFRENPSLLRNFVNSSGQKVERAMRIAVRDHSVPESMIFGHPTDNLDAYHHVYIPMIRKLPVEQIQVLCNKLHDMREVFRSNIRGRLYLGIQLNIVAPDDSEHVAYVRASRLYREYMEEFGLYVGNCATIVTNKVEGSW